MGNFRCWLTGHDPKPEDNCTCRRCGKKEVHRWKFVSREVHTDTSPIYYEYTTYKCRCGKEKHEGFGESRGWGR